MTHPERTGPTIDTLHATICDFLLPFLLTEAGGNVETARAAILQLIDAYNPNGTTELDLVGRLIGFSITSMDNLRLSMGEGLSDTKVLRYRSNAVSLSRAAEQARKVLHAVQGNQETTGQIPRPASPPRRSRPLRKQHSPVPPRPSFLSARAPSTIRRWISRR
jgi:hypothetical protein